MAPELVVTPGGYRPRDMVHRIGPNIRLRMLTGRLQGIDAADSVIADYGSVPRDGGNPALTPGYALPPGLDTPEGSETGLPLGRGWIAFAHWTHEGRQPVSAFRATWTVPPEPATRSGQTVFLFNGMQDSIPMTLLPALQWGPSAAGGGEYWAVASWYIGGTTGTVFHGELVPVNTGDVLSGVIVLAERRREHGDYRCGFDGVAGADLAVHNVRPMSRCGTILAAYGVRYCTDYPETSATGFREIEIQTGFTHPPVAWTPVNAITDCGQHVVVLSDANPGGEVDVHFHQFEAIAEPAEAAEAEEIDSIVATEAATAAVAAAAVDSAPEPEPSPEGAEFEAAALPVAPAVELALEPEAAAEAVEPDVAVPPAAEAPGEPAPEPEPAAEAADTDVAAPLAAEAPGEPAPEPEPAAEAIEIGRAQETEVAAPFAAPMRERLDGIGMSGAGTAFMPGGSPAGEAPPAAARSLAPVTPEVSAGTGRLVEITINNNGPASPAAGSLETRMLALESAIAGIGRAMVPSWRPEPAAHGGGDLMSQLERLVRLRETGMLTDDEFAALKAKLIGS